MKIESMNQPTWLDVLKDDLVQANVDIDKFRQDMLEHQQQMCEQATKFWHHWLGVRARFNHFRLLSLAR